MFVFREIVIPSQKGGMAFVIVTGLCKVSQPEAMALKHICLSSVFNLSWFENSLKLILILVVTFCVTILMEFYKWNST